MKNTTNEIVMYESSDGAVKLPVRIDYGEETVWLTQAQIAGLFERYFRYFKTYQQCF